ncbi:Gfo/Idh/MocA family protein [Candidatus Hydrogenedentota bacterium]
MEKIRFGIIGCAGIARKNFLPAMKSCACAEPIAVASLLFEEAEECATQFGCEAMKNYEALLSRDDINAVYIATPNALHADLAVAAARAGHHVLCEKPLAVNIEETRRILDACDKNNVALLEGLAYRFHSQHATLRALIEEGRIGEPILLQAWFGFPPLNDTNFRYSPELGGGAILDAGAYTIHIARSFFGREPITVHACLDKSDKQVEIHGSALLDFGQGQTAQLAFGFNNMYRNSYAIWGTEGLVTLTRAFSIPATFAPTLVLERQSCREERVLEPFDQFAGEINSFCDGLRDAATRKMWRDDAMRQSEALKALNESTM